MSKDRKGISSQGWHRYDTIYKTTWDIKTTLWPKVIVKTLMEIDQYGALMTMILTVERKPTWSSRCRSMPITIGIVHVYHRATCTVGQTGDILIVVEAEVMEWTRSWSMAWHHNGSWLPDAQRFMDIQFLVNERQSDEFGDHDERACCGGWE